MKYLIIGFLGFSFFQLNGQGGNLGQLELNVTNKYKANVAEAVKVNDFPDFKDTTTNRLPVKINITSQPLRFNYTPEPLPPARIDQVPVEELKNGLVRIGYGFYNTPLAEVYYNSGRSSGHSFGFSGKHLSTQKGVDNILYEDNAMATNKIKGYFKKYYKDVKWSSEAFANFDRVSYYGRDTTYETIDFDVTTPDNWYKQFGISTTIKEIKNKGLGFYDYLGINYYHLSDNFQSTEDLINFNSTLEVPAQGQMVDVDMNFTYFSTINDSVIGRPLIDTRVENMQQSNFTVQLGPNISTHWNDVLFQFGLNIYYNKRQGSFLSKSDVRLFFFPEVKISYPIVADVINVYGGIDGNMSHNTIQSHVEENPFINPGQVLKPSRTMDINIGMNGILSSTTSFDVKGGFKNVNDMVFYYRHPFYRSLTDSLGMGLTALYDDVDMVYARGELNLNLHNNLQIGLAGELRGFNNKYLKDSWHRPNFISELNTVYTLKEKIKFSSKLFYSGARPAFVQEEKPGMENTLKAYLRGDLGVEYLYNSSLSAFMNVYNVFNSKYEHYLGYQAQKINFLFGISYQF